MSVMSPLCLSYSKTPYLISSEKRFCCSFLFLLQIIVLLRYTTGPELQVRKCWLDIFWQGAATGNHPAAQSTNNQPASEECGASGAVNMETQTATGYEKRGGKGMWTLVWLGMQIKVLKPRRAAVPVPPQLQTSSLSPLSLDPGATFH